MMVRNLKTWAILFISLYQISFSCKRIVQNKDIDIQTTSMLLR